MPPTRARPPRIGGSGMVSWRVPRRLNRADVDHLLLPRVADAAVGERDGPEHDQQDRQNLHRPPPRQQRHARRRPAGPFRKSDDGGESPEDAAQMRFASPEKKPSTARWTRCLTVPWWIGHSRDGTRPLLEVLGVDRAAFDRLQVRDAAELLLAQRRRRLELLRHAQARGAAHEVAPDRQRVARRRRPRGRSSSADRTRPTRRPRPTTRSRRTRRP